MWFKKKKKKSNRVSEQRLKKRIRGPWETLRCWLSRILIWRSKHLLCCLTKSILLVPAISCSPTQSAQIWFLACSDWNQNHVVGLVFFLNATQGGAIASLAAWHQINRWRWNAVSAFLWGDVAGTRMSGVITVAEDADAASSDLITLQKKKKKTLQRSDLRS